jgi:hypothetical protein
MSARNRIILGLALTAGIVIGLLVLIPPGEVVGHIARTDPFYFSLACLVNFGTVALRSRRWQVLTSYAGRVPYRSLARMVIIGIAVNSAIPLRAGEAMRAYSLASEWGISKRESVSTVLVDRSFDAISFGLEVLMATLAFDLPTGVSSESYGIAISSLAVVVSFPLVAWFGRTMRNRPELLCKNDFQRRIGDRLEPLARGYAALTTGRVIRSLGLSMAAWIPQVVVVLLVARALSVEIPLGAVVMGVFAVNAASTLPLTPANVGVFQVAFLFVLSAYGVDKASSLAVATVYQVAIVVPVAIAALVLLNLRGSGTRAPEAA